MKPIRSRCLIRLKGFKSIKNLTREILLNPNIANKLFMRYSNTNLYMCCHCYIQEVHKIHQRKIWRPIVGLNLVANRKVYTSLRSTANDKMRFHAIHFTQYQTKLLPFEKASESNMLDKLKIHKSNYSKT